MDFEAKYQIYQHPLYLRSLRAELKTDDRILLLGFYTAHLVALISIQQYRAQCRVGHTDHTGGSSFTLFHKACDTILSNAPKPNK